MAVCQSFEVTQMACKSFPENLILVLLYRRWQVCRMNACVLRSEVRCQWRHDEEAKSLGQCCGFLQWFHTFGQWPIIDNNRPYVPKRLFQNERRNTTNGYPLSQEMGCLKRKESSNTSKQRAWQSLWSRKWHFELQCRLGSHRHAQVTSVYCWTIWIQIKLKMSK